MSARRVTFVAGLVGGLGWLVKVALIWGNGGTNTDEGAVAVFFFLGFAGLLVAFAAAGAALTTGRPVWLRALAVALGAVAFFVVFGALEAVLAPLAPDDHWFAEEIEIVAAALLGLVIAATAQRRGPVRHAAAA